MAVIDNAVYWDGVRIATPTSLAETFEAKDALGGFAWIGLYRPSSEELDEVATEYGLHHLAVEDAKTGHQRSKLESYGKTRFVVLRPARYDDSHERVEFGEVELFVGPDFVVTVRHAESPDLHAVRMRLEANPDLLALGPQAVLYAVLDQVVDEYSPVIAGLENDIDEIEDQIFEGDPAVSRRIYALSREVTEFQRATRPLPELIERLRGELDKNERAGLELRRALRDVADHAIRIAERGETFKQLLQNALTVQLTLVGQRQGDEVKRISSWAAILFTPTLVGTIYGMNFDHMPELHWFFGYPFAIALMVGMGFGLYFAFKRRGWL
ncbi:magnesium/cobalt transporter CorA [Glaciibacter flavus]|uniref:Magnesium transport protein CorA n=1 Tax=Orlajensenia flava TaxID=2565934 RepID=A0A4S4FZ10_9MICO|nr:magnesium/cobalt transporter CorA [Glaciibacter flavus]THG36083.1 magnesium/cobalt transporter CorA [Glaciibacter flavus]